MRLLLCASHAFGHFCSFLLGVNVFYHLWLLVTGCFAFFTNSCMGYIGVCLIIFIFYFQRDVFRLGACMFTLFSLFLHGGVQQQNEQRCEQEIEEIRRQLESGIATSSTSISRYSDEAIDEQKHCVRIADEKVALATQAYDMVYKLSISCFKMGREPFSASCGIVQFCTNIENDPLYSADPCSRRRN